MLDREKINGFSDELEVASGNRPVRYHRNQHPMQSNARNIESLSIELTPEENPIRRKLRNHFAEQRNSMPDLVA